MCYTRSVKTITVRISFYLSPLSNPTFTMLVLSLLYYVLCVPCDLLFSWIFMLCVLSVILLLVLSVHVCVCVCVVACVLCVCWSVCDGILCFCVVDDLLTARACCAGLLSRPIRCILSAACKYRCSCMPFSYYFTPVLHSLVIFRVLSTFRVTSICVIFSVHFHLCLYLLILIVFSTLSSMFLIIHLFHTNKTQIVTECFTIP